MLPITEYLSLVPPHYPALLLALPHYPALFHIKGAPHGPKPLDFDLKPFHLKHVRTGAHRPGHKQR